jgi:hypothetical protein
VPVFNSAPEDIPAQSSVTSPQATATVAGALQLSLPLIPDSTISSFGMQTGKDGYTRIPAEVPICTVCTSFGHATVDGSRALYPNTISADQAPRNGNHSERFVEIFLSLTQ